jgi:hypothetical protein
MKIRRFDDQLRDVLYVAHFSEVYEREALGLSCPLDISDRVEAQAKLTRMQAEFAHAARVSMLGELTASIAREVNQPLGAILTSGETAMRWLDRPEPDLGELRALADHGLRRQARWRHHSADARDGFARRAGTAVPRPERRR